uniref:Uncharacterized protein n=1 Tax=Meloidogyne floridensis TaxID=298350 RepID=A0A915NF69_9BILA
MYSCGYFKIYGQVCELLCTITLKRVKNHENLGGYKHFKYLNQFQQACVNFLSANKQSVLVSKEWRRFKSSNKNFAFRLLESALNEEKQIEEEKICSNCEQRRNSSRYSPYYHHPSPRFSYLRSPSWNQPSPSYTPLSPSYNQASPSYSPT